MTTLCEGLEPRVLFTAAPAAVTAALVEGALHVAGTKKADAITVAPSPQDPYVIEVRSGPGAGALVHAFNAAELFPAVVISAGKGHDTISVDPAVAMAVVVFGGPGHDVISGGGGNDVLDGGPGHDRLAGNAGQDLLEGGPGRDALDGGAGDDSLSGGTGKDAVTGGEGDDLFDDDPAAEITDRAAEEILSEPVLTVGRRR